MRALLLVLLLFAGRGHASGVYERIVVYDLTKAADGDTKADGADFIRARARECLRWWPARALDLHDDGFGFDGKENSVIDGWAHFTEPIAVGVPRWAPCEVSVRVRVDRDSKGPETVYARFSPDTACWSDWQALPKATGPGMERWTHAGTLRAARPERAAFEEACYRDSKPGEGPDAEATLKRLLEQDPRYLERGIPCIGYVQILHESEYRGGRRLRRLEVGVGCVIPGPVRPEKGYWRFRRECRVDPDGQLRIPPGANPRELSLRATAVTDEGLAALASVPGLRRLDLADTKITDAGLARVAGLRLLEALDLSGTQVTDEGLRHLEVFRFLDELGLRGTPVTDEAVERLREALRAREARVPHVERQEAAESRRIDRLIAAVKEVTLLHGGTEYGDGSPALRRQLDLFASRVRTAEDFIAEIAAVEGDPYKVRLADGTVVDLATWLRGQLDR